MRAMIDRRRASRTPTGYIDGIGPDRALGQIQHSSINI
jgi:hypothetical protein